MPHSQQSASSASRPAGPGFDRRAITALLDEPASRAAGLARLKDSGLRTVPSLAARYLEDDDAGVRVQALQCLLQSGTRRYAAQVAPRLRDSAWQARIDALLCLTLWRAKRQLAAILPLLDDPDQHVRCYAARAVGRLGSARDVPLLRGKLAVETSEKACAGYCVALARLTGQPIWLEELAEWLAHDDEGVRRTAANCLMDAASQETAGLITMLFRQALARETVAAAHAALERHLARLDARPLSGRAQDA